MLSVLKGIYRLFRCIREFVVSLFFVLFVMILFALVGILNSENSKKEKHSPSFEQGALTLNLDGYLADNHDEFGDFHRFLRAELSNSREPLKISTFDVVRAIKKATKDEKITGIVLDLAYFEGGDTPSLRFVGEALKLFKQSGKPVIAIGELYTQKQYYLASFADQIYLNKAGMVELRGLSYSNLYFKSLFDKIEAVPHIFRVGSYKSAVEPFLRDDMSPEARENATLWLNKLWQHLQQDMAQNRGLNRGKLLPDTGEYLKKFREAKGDDAQFALQQGWVTELLTSQQIKQKLAEQFGEDAEKGYKQISYFDYEFTLSDRFNVDAPHKIAIVNVEGEIVWGESDESSAGSDDIVKLLNQAKDDETVEGVILRVNSPGGSAVGSELIRQAVEDLQKSGKPVVASMGGMAASGGYWISATADKIIAAPTTLTGSIGIFGLAVSFEKTAKKIGISQDGITTSPLAETSELKTLPKEQAELIQISIENGYDKFLDLVAQGRKMSKSEVDKIAQGQVWLGESAFEKGLVDQLGDFDDAYMALKDLINQQRQTKHLAELDNIAVQWLIAPNEDMLSQVMREFKMKLNVDLSSLFGELSISTLPKQEAIFNRFNDPKQLYLYCLNCGEVN